MRDISRRAVLAGGLAALAPSFGRFGGAAAAEPSDLRMTDIGGLVAIGGAGGNVLVRPSSEGQVVVDSGGAGFADALLAALDELPGAHRVETLFNTHWHLDQVSGNAALRRRGAAILAHEKTRLHLYIPHYRPDADGYTRPLPVDAHPTESFFTQGETTAGGERIEYGYLLEAHTDGDIYVFFRGANVVAVGDAVSPARDPELDWFGGGWIGGRVDSLARLLELGDERTRFVPSYGEPVGRAEVQAEHDLMRTLFDRMVELLRMGYSAEEMVAEGVMDGLGRTFDDPLKFVDAAHRSLWGHHNTLSHDIV